jgi:AraC family transcriptional regulator, regulatory protein of adaptative response / DNA-3-methyladenine glycosylase II
MSSSNLTLDAAYVALKSRDARFDGQFFMGVRSTGIYCRPVCRVRAPRKENCTVFTHAAQAEQAGFRPCLKCRPELAPARTREALNVSLAQAAAQRLQTTQRISVTQIAEELGVSDRHLRRIFEAHYGVSPLAFATTHRMLLAKRLLTDSQRSVSAIAQAAGFGSARQMNTLFAQHYRLSPTALRKAQPVARDANATNEVTLVIRAPYAYAQMFSFFAQRALPGVEVCAVGTMEPFYMRTFALAHAGTTLRGWLRVRKAARSPHLILSVSDTLWPAIGEVLPRVEKLFDTRADSATIDAQLGALLSTPGLRVPGVLEPFEIGVRAVLGQQVTVVAASRIAARLAARFGERIDTPFPELNLLFPSARTLANADVNTIAQCGIIRTRAQTILTLAQRCVEGALTFDGAFDDTIAQLRTIKGIGPWTAQYIAMRALRAPDALPVKDVALYKALGVDNDADLIAAVEHARPWRAYATINLWDSLTKK